MVLSISVRLLHDQPNSQCNRLPYIVGIVNVRLLGNGIIGKVVGVRQHVSQDLLPFWGRPVRRPRSSCALRTFWQSLLPRQAVDILKVFLELIVRIQILLAQGVRAISKASIRGRWVIRPDVRPQRKERIKGRVSSRGRKTFVTQAERAPSWLGVGRGADEVL